MDMRTPNKMTGQVILLCTAMLFLYPALGMAQLKKMTAQELANESSSILYGKCVKTESAWNESGDMIITTVTIAPEYYLKGDLGSMVQVTVPGGRVGDIIYDVSEMPAFTKGEEVFAFIWENPSGKQLVTGGYQGKLKIGVDSGTGKRTVSGRKLSEAVPVSARQPIPSSTPAIERISLEQFTREIENYLQEK